MASRVWRLLISSAGQVRSGAWQARADARLGMLIGPAVMAARSRCPRAGQGGSAAVAAGPASPGAPPGGPARADCTGGLAAVMVPAWGSLRSPRRPARADSPPR
jgi:hypothetical protein